MNGSKFQSFAEWMRDPAHPWRLPAPIALAVWLGLLFTLDPAGSYPRLIAGPGITVDESFNVQQGVLLVEIARTYHLGLLHPASLREIFGDPGYLPDHPPLGRLLIGIGHHLSWTLISPADPDSPFVTACARVAPATAFAALVWLVGWMGIRWYGNTAGCIGAVSLVLMPRLVGQAQLAVLETFIGLAYTAAVLIVAAHWPPSSPSENTRADPPSDRTAALSGLLFGFALLTKIQAVFLPIPIAAWALFHWRQRALRPLIVWGLSGLALFFAGWPWLWLDPVNHLLEYLGRTTDRLSIFVWYFGERIADVNVPWHYPWVLFLVTVPIGLHLLGVLGAGRSGSNLRTEPREQLLLGSLLFPLIVFSLPGVAVYDGARLFLIVFPLWGLFIGRGGAVLLSWLKSRMPARWAVALLSLFLIGQGYGVVSMHPCPLSYYNLLAGGLKGAERLGFEPTYWGDSLTRDFWQQTTEAVPRGAAIAVAPTLHQFYTDELRSQSPVLRRHAVQLVDFDPEQPDRTEFIALFRRLSYLPTPLIAPPPEFVLVTEVRRQGVPLAALYRRKPASPGPPIPDDETATATRKTTDEQNHPEGKTAAP